MIHIPWHVEIALGRKLGRSETKFGHFQLTECTGKNSDIMRRSDSDLSVPTFRNDSDCQSLPRCLTRRQSFLVSRSEQSDPIYSEQGGVGQARRNTDIAPLKSLTSRYWVTSARKHNVSSVFSHHSRAFLFLPSNIQSWRCQVISADCLGILSTMPYFSIWIRRKRIWYSLRSFHQLWRLFRVLIYENEVLMSMHATVCLLASPTLWS